MQLTLPDVRLGHAHLCQLHQFFLSCDLMSPAAKRPHKGAQVLTGSMHRVYEALLYAAVC